MISLFLFALGAMFALTGAQSDLTPFTFILYNCSLFPYSTPCMALPPGINVENVVLLVPYSASGSMSGDARATLTPTYQVAASEIYGVQYAGNIDDFSLFQSHRKSGRTTFIALEPRSPQSEEGSTDENQGSPNYIDPDSSTPPVCEASGTATAGLIILSLLSASLFVFACYLIRTRRRDHMRAGLLRPYTASLNPSVESIPWPVPTSVEVGELTDLDLEAGTTSFHCKSDSYAGIDALSDAGNKQNFHVSPFLSPPLHPPPPPPIPTAPPQLHIKTDDPFMIRTSQWFSSTAAGNTTKSSPTRAPTRKSIRSQKAASRYPQSQSKSKTPDMPHIGPPDDVIFHSGRLVGCSWDASSSSTKAGPSSSSSSDFTIIPPHKIPRRLPPPPYSPH